jgi:hypothetical protein
VLKVLGHNDIERFEKWLLLYRFGYIYNDRLLFELTLKLNERVKEETLEYLIKGKYLSKYEHHIRSGGHFSIWEDRDIFVKFVSENIEFEELKELFMKHLPRYVEFDVFRGYYFYYKSGGELKKECRWDEVYENTFKALEDTKGRIKPFLKALVALYSEERPSLMLGFSLNRIQEKIIELEGRVRNLTPVDYVALKAYKIYYKTGSRRYPEHALPIEAIPPIEKALEDFNTSKK